MMSSYHDPFDALFALQRALDARLASDDNNIAAASITIKVQRYFGIMLNVP